MTALPPEIITVFVSWGPPGVLCFIFYKLWRDSEEKRDTERKDASTALTASYETRLNESRESFKGLSECVKAVTEAKQTIEALAAIIKDRKGFQ